MRKARKFVIQKQPLTVFQVRLSKFSEHAEIFRQFLQLEFVTSLNVSLYHQAAMVGELETRLAVLEKVLNNFSDIIVDDSEPVELKAWGNVQRVAQGLAKAGNAYLDASSLRAQAAALTDFVEYADLLVAVSK